MSSTGRAICDVAEEAWMSSTVTRAQAPRQELSGFRGRLIGPDDTDYERARAVHSATIDRRPALIARDVARAVGLPARTG